MTLSYADIEAAPAVVLAGFEPEEESPIVFLRLRKAFRKRGLKVYVDRTVRDARPDQDGRQRDRHRARRRSGRARRAFRPVSRTPGNADPGWRATRELAGRVLRRRHASPRRPARDWGGCHDAQATVGRWKPVQRRTFCPGDAHWPTPTRVPRWRPLGTSKHCRRPLAETRRESFRRQPTERLRHCSSEESSSTTCPIPRPRAPRWTPPPSSSAWSCARARSPISPTSSSPSLPSPRRRAVS